MSLLMGFLYASDREINVPCSEWSPATNMRHGRTKDLAGRGWGIAVAGGRSSWGAGGRKGCWGRRGARGTSLNRLEHRAGAHVRELAVGKEVTRGAVSDKEGWGSFGRVSWVWRSSGVFWGAVGDVGEPESPLQHPSLLPLSLSLLPQVFVGTTMPKPESESHSTTEGRENIGMKAAGGSCKGIPAVAADEAACTARAVSAPPSSLVFQYREEKPWKVALSFSLSSGTEKAASFPPQLLVVVPWAGHEAGWPGSLWDGHWRGNPSGFGLIDISLPGTV